MWGVECHSILCGVIVFSALQVFGFFFVYKHKSSESSSNPKDDNFCNPVIFTFARVATPALTAMFFVYPTSLCVLLKIVVKFCQMRFLGESDEERTRLISS